MRCRSARTCVPTAWCASASGRLRRGRSRSSSKARRVRCLLPPWKTGGTEESVIYELHIGTFTSDGTFRAAIDKLDDLVELGVTAIELMPIADFPGARNWGYDGVYLFAPDATYGRPEDLKVLADAAHANGLMIFLDVVYNHFGPDGNYLDAYACQFFTDRHKTPWGAAINYDGPDSRPVRNFMIHNALYWLEEFHFDGLRLDAVHAIIDDSEMHLLEELADRVRDTFCGERHIHLILENEENEAHRLKRGPGGEPRIYTAQWNDDVHHVLHTAATGEDAGYYAEYRGDTDKLARSLAEGFAFQGEMMAYRGEPRGEPSAHLPPTAFVAFIQNHDQVGNRAFGDRLTASTPAEAVRAIAAIYLLAPQIPMLFMGEEWAAAQPFPFFCDFEAELGEAVRKGRREEFAKFPEFHDERRASVFPIQAPRIRSVRPSSVGMICPANRMPAGSTGTDVSLQSDGRRSCRGLPRHPVMQASTRHVARAPSASVGPLATGAGSSFSPISRKPR
jgi:malto-oligosyltrehalose trehalohydrolase